MSGIEYVAAALLLARGIRLCVWWWRRPFAAVDVTDHFLYAMFLTGRIGMWFAVSGLFAIFGSIATRGRAFVDDANEFRWFVGVFAVLGAMQFLGGQLLGRRTPREP